MDIKAKVIIVKSYCRKKLLSLKVIIVTGASSRIGGAAARLLASRGAKVASKFAHKRRDEGYKAKGYKASFEIFF